MMGATAAPMSGSFVCDEELWPCVKTGRANGFSGCYVLKGGDGYAGGGMCCYIFRCTFKPVRLRVTIVFCRSLGEASAPKYSNKHLKLLRQGEAHFLMLTLVDATAVLARSLFDPMMALRSSFAPRFVSRSSTHSPKRILDISLCLRAYPPLCTQRETMSRPMTTGATGLPPPSRLDVRSISARFWIMAFFYCIFCRHQPSMMLGRLR